MTNDELQSKTINNLRFPLIVGVVLIHAHITTVTMNGIKISCESAFFVALLKPYLFPSVVIYALLAFFCVCFKEQSWVSFICSLSILFGIVLTISLSAYFFGMR